ncbi:DUF2249 domain-containing protein [Inmirania thermothiophila]|uniref:Uncharacterized protein DUF2249 n=1 Tax=Inmirania thermothiophila TaxID=1750597 RepID=A0A3N1XS99_9GAMM|nr:DUF2249 domain-containing protein [Inmirania thermothiophila]ROR29530.1 uncharacterized protein DUF2249 [Inmirania thermothiophila]
MTVQARERVLDVRDLEPCEPLERALEAAAALAPGEYLRLLHRREPHPLYELLARQGLRHRTRRGRQAPVEVLIWREGDAVAARAVEDLTGAE